MPYIKTRRREALKYYPVAMNAGELNYLITTTLKYYVRDVGLNYQTINDVVGALEGAKLEFYRRIVVPYEDNKIKENGDVYG